MKSALFKSLLRHYLSCMDAEEAMQLKLKRDHHGKSFVFLDAVGGEKLFSENLSSLHINPNSEQQDFIKKRAVQDDALIDAFYGFPVCVDEKDFLLPFFFVEVGLGNHPEKGVTLIPKPETFAVNRAYFFREHGPEELERICEELEGEFGSFEARLKASKPHRPSWASTRLDNPILFRSNYGGVRKATRYDLAQLTETDVMHQETALKHLLEGGGVSAPVAAGRSVPILEMGTLNAQQEEAVSNGLTAPLSIVTGPPGTGKTQVVTSLLASAAWHGETVLFASNNNLPVDGVYERLGRHTGKAGNWLLRLGNREKRRECRDVVEKLFSKARGGEHADLEEKRREIETFDARIAEANASLAEARTLQRNITNLHERENELEKQLPKMWVGQCDEADPPVLDGELLKQFSRHSQKGIWLWLRQLFTSAERFVELHNKHLEALCEPHPELTAYDDCRVVDAPSWDEAVPDARRKVDITRQHQKWAMLVAQRRRLEAQLLRHASSADVAELKEKKRALSAECFSALWQECVAGRIGEARHAFGAYMEEIAQFTQGRHKRIKDKFSELKPYFPIWITTNQSAGDMLPLKPALFDMVVIDEAGQCDVPSVLPLLHRAKRAVIIGDPKQFKHITQLRDDLETMIAKRAGVREHYEDWSFLGVSAFDRAYKSSLCRTFLAQHYRCHPDIIAFSNTTFYGGQLVEQTARLASANPLPIKERGLVWHSVTGTFEKAQTAGWNPAEVDAIRTIYTQWAQEGLFDDSHITYGVVTPFRKQAQEIRNALSACAWFGPVEDRFVIGTAHSFQGSECDVLVYSPVIAAEMPRYLVDFAAKQTELVNVSVTRAKQLFYITGDLEACQQLGEGNPLHQLAAHAHGIQKRRLNTPTLAEQKMADILSEMQLNYTEQYECDRYRLDFLVHSPAGARYDVEVDGDIHLSAENIEHDGRRDAFIKQQGLNIIRFAARDVMHKPDLIKARLTRL